MTEISHILVLSQPEFVQRQIGAQLGIARRSERRGIVAWLGFTRRSARTA